jgi:mannitol-specific phosphotransferase system IIBC component
MRLLIEVLPLPLGLLAVLMAQTAVPPMDVNIIPLIGNGVTVVILAWYVIYDVRTRTPNMLAAFQQELAESRAAFEKEKAEDRAEHAQIVEAMRTAFLLEQAELRKVFATEQAASRAQAANDLESLRKMLWENMTAMRTAVHDVRDTAQHFITKQELSAREAKMDSRTGDAG